MSDASGSSSFTPPWADADVSFAVTQLAGEFPAVAKEKVTLAVHSAAPFVEPDRGRVQLLRKARELLRPTL